ncbi:MAG: ATP-dependent zinc metalloprotease FtsH [Bacteroidota bacterium]
MPEKDKQNTQEKEPKKIFPDPKKNKQEGKNKKENKPPKPKISIYWIYAAIAILFIGIQMLNIGNNMIEITWNRFENQMLKNHDVEKVVVVNKERAEVYIKPDKISKERYSDIREKSFGPNKEGPHYYFNIGSVETFNKQLEEAQKGFSEEEKIIIAYETRRDIFGELLGWFLPIIILVVIWIIIFRKMNSKAGGAAGNIFSVGKSKAKLFDKETSVKTDFSNVAGLEEAKAEIKELVEFLKEPEKYTQLGAKIPKGALLIGPPGTGKTLLARAAAGEADVPFFSISGSDFVEMFVGVGASRVRDLFKQAKEKAPCIVFIDEIDAIGRSRGKNPNMGANDERENTLNQLLSEMDGFEPNSGVIIMAATNRADMLDKALIRAGRFDRQIHVELPDLKERQEIFNVHLKPLKIDKDVDIMFLAKQTPGFSGADIQNVCNEAALIAGRKKKKTIDKQDFLDAVDRIIAGLERKNKIISKLEKKTIAFHEAGHATVSWFLKHAHPLVKVTIIPRGRSLGSAWYLPEERQITNKAQLYDELCASLGGRAAEEETFGEISTGALNDLEKATKQVYAMITYFGMSKKIGNISYYDSSGRDEYAFTKPYSEKTAELIDAEAKRIIEEVYEKAKQILRDHKEGLEKLANKLLESEIIFKEDLVNIFGKRPFENEYEKEEEPMIKKGNDENKKTTNNKQDNSDKKENNE